VIAIWIDSGPPEHDLRREPRVWSTVPACAPRIWSSSRSCPARIGAPGRPLGPSGTAARPC